MSKVSKKIIKLLEENKIKHDVIEHKTTYTAFDTAATNVKNKIKPEEIVKTLVMKVDKEYVLALMPSNKMLDKMKLKRLINDQIKKEKKNLTMQAKKAVGDVEKKELEKQAKNLLAVKKIDFAKEVWMKKNIMGNIGAVPPFSSLTKLKIFVDGSLLRQKQLYLGSGEYEFSIKVTPAQYQKLEKDFVKGNINVAMKKKKK
ncbi:MAG: YbaK/EbsC family protein [Patescibacteria group bacterium]|nr:YbaK/EbsC family protein [Patescibacteria group bacterium]